MAGVKMGQRHGMSHTPTYKTWEMMMQRCTNPKFDSYSNYGGRGIEVCERWKDFRLFYKDMGDRPKGKTLDRKDNDGGYSPENCKWSTQSEQLRNTRLRSDNTSGHKGVYWHKTSEKWMAELTLENKSIYLGLFNTKEEAIDARKAGEVEHYIVESEDAA